MRLFRAQGATEYLVLLAVVLIIALVSVALPGFFPGMASDSQLAQNQVYWRSATPIAVVETPGAYAYTPNPGFTMAYWRIRNNGNYPVRLVKILGQGGSSASGYQHGNLTTTHAQSLRLKAQVKAAYLSHSIFLIPSASPCLQAWVVD